MPRLAALVLLAFTALPACTVGDDPQDLVDADLRLGADPCGDAQLRQHITVRASGDGHRFIGTDGDDVIFGTPGDDVIFGNGGNDIICAGAGDDYIDGGDGKDYLYGGAGDDIIHGRGGSDHIWGGPGDDVLFGDILDDHLFGEEGNDILIGGHGTDELVGGPGDDFLRGDTGNDTFDGGAGYDVVSFATATPPGQPEVREDGTANPVTGVAVGAQANGDGGQEAMTGVEEVVGSEFTDRIDAARYAVQPTFGEAVPTPAGYAFIRGAVDRAGLLVDVGVVVLGTPGANAYQVVGKAGNVVDIVAANPPAAGEGCVQLADRTRCDVGAYLGAHAHRRPSPFHYVLAWLDAGDDKLELAGDFPRDFEVTADGGPGDDHLIGGDEQDIFFTGVDGRDWLEGSGGDDALISESHHTARWADGDRPRWSDYHDGADTLDGGAGNDQLVVDYVCGGHRYLGGPGNDIAGFARSGTHDIWAQLGGPAPNRTQWWGFAANMDLCGDHPAAWTSWKRGEDADLETLEASDGNDHLWGDSRSDTIWGRGGADHIDGEGGRDTILGADGNDTIVAHPGDDISDGAGN